MPQSPFTMRTIRVGVLAALLGTTALAGIAAVPTAPAPQNAGLATRAVLPDFSDMVAKVKPAVVSVTTKFAARPAADEEPSPFPMPGMRRGQAPRGQAPQSEARGQPVEARGSGFIVSPDGIVVTNNHVVQDAKSVTVTLDDGRELTAKVIGRDPRSDVAVLKIESAAPLPYLELAEQTTVRPGEWVLAMGNPFGLGGTVTAGIVSARGRNIGAGPYDDFIQIDAPINHGNSGGPLFNQAGQVVGINTAIFSPSGGSVGIGFAIPSDMVKKIVAELQTTGHVTRGYLGVETQTIDKALAAALRITDSSHAGALIAAIAPDGPAAKADLHEGDVLRGVDGNRIDDSRALARAVAALKPGTSAKFEVLRDGKTETIAVTVGTMPGDQLAAAPVAKAPDGIGVALAPLSPQLRAQLELPASTKGAIIASVKPDSPAAQAGLQEGDLILGVGGRNVASAEDAAGAIRKAVTAGHGVALRVMRDGKTGFVAVDVQQQG